MKSGHDKEQSSDRLFSVWTASRLSLWAAAVALSPIGIFATPALAQNIEASPSVLTATVVKGQSTTLTLNLRKTGTDQHNWEPKTNVTWLNLTPGYGSINTITTELDQMKVTVNSANMQVGTVRGSSTSGIRPPAFRG